MAWQNKDITKAQLGAPRRFIRITYKNVCKGLLVGVERTQRKLNFQKPTQTCVTANDTQTCETTHDTQTCGTAHDNVVSSRHLSRPEPRLRHN